MIGGSRLRRKLKSLEDEQLATVRKAIRLGAEDVETTIKKKLQRGSRSGRPRPRGGRSSAPGEPPKTDTGRLVSSIEAQVSPDGLEATIGVHNVTNVQYAPRLEFGFVGSVTIAAHVRRMTKAFGRVLRNPIQVSVRSYSQTIKQPARPFIFPSFEERKKAIRTRLQKAVNDTFKRAGRRR